MLAAKHRLAAAGVIDLVALISLAPDVFALVPRLSHVGNLLRNDPDNAIAHLGGGALWCIAAWLGLGLLATAAAHSGGSERRLADIVSRRLLPAAVRRVLTGAVGVGVALAPALALAAPTTAALAASAPAAPIPLWPVDPPAHAAPRTPPLWPVDVTPRVAARAVSSTSVTVQPGDCLWSIAQQQLGTDAPPARIAALAHAWFQANRHVIGADPSLIHPGQVLQAPKEAP